MSFSTNLSIVIAVATVFSPLTAFADTGSTAAAVSIKFNNCCGATNGNFLIVPGGRASGGGSGVSELSAAVATGETSATANSTSGIGGTTANAAGWSAPVDFTYESITLNRADQNSSQSSLATKDEQEASMMLASKSEQHLHGGSNSTFLNTSLKASATDYRTNNNASKSTVNDTRTSYHYSGPSTGLRYLPNMAK
jgi:hypothetical protein